MELPALQPTQWFEVFIEEAKAGAVAVEHNQMLVCFLADSLHRELIERTVLPAQFHHAGTPSARTIRVVKGFGGNFTQLIRVRTLETGWGSAIRELCCLSSLEMGGGLVMQVRQIRENFVFGSCCRYTSPLYKANHQRACGNGGSLVVAYPLTEAFSVSQWEKCARGCRASSSLSRIRSSRDPLGIVFNWTLVTPMDVLMGRVE